MDHSAAASGEFAVGCRLAIKTILGDDFEGVVLTSDKSSNVVVLHILHTRFVQTAIRSTL
jgi:hypothetical protein